MECMKLIRYETTNLDQSVAEKSMSRTRHTRKGLKALEGYQLPPAIYSQIDRMRLAVVRHFD